MQVADNSGALTALYKNINKAPRYLVVWCQNNCRIKTIVPGKRALKVDISSYRIRNSKNKRVMKVHILF